MSIETGALRRQLLSHLPSPTSDLLFSEWLLPISAGSHLDPVSPTTARCSDLSWTPDPEGPTTAHSQSAFWHIELRIGPQRDWLSFLGFNGCAPRRDLGSALADGAIGLFSRPFWVLLRGSAENQCSTSWWRSMIFFFFFAFFECSEFWTTRNAAFALAAFLTKTTSCLFGQMPVADLVAAGGGIGSCLSAGVWCLASLADMAVLGSGLCSSRNRVIGNQCADRRMISGSCSPSSLSPTSRCFCHIGIAWT